MSSWPIFKTTRYNYLSMSVFDKMELIKMVLQYWVYQNVTNPYNIIPGENTHVGLHYNNINNIVTYLSIRTWGSKWKNCIDLNAFKRDFIMYIKDPKIKVVDDPNIEIFREKFGQIIGVNNLSLIKKKEMYKKIIDHWVTIQGVFNTKSIYNENEIKDEIIRIIKKEVNDYNNNHTYKQFMNQFNRYVAGVSKEESPFADKIRKSGFIFPKYFYVEKKSNIEEIDDEDYDIIGAGAGAGAGVKRPRIEEIIELLDDSDDEVNDIWIKAAVFEEVDESTEFDVGAGAGAGAGASVLALLSLV